MKTLEVAPYPYTVEISTEMSVVKIAVRNNETEKRVAIAEYDNFLKRYTDVQIKTKTLQHTKDIITVLEVAEQEGF